MLQLCYITTGDELHYTGMGNVGDQILTGNQNGTLYNANMDYSQ